MIRLILSLFIIGSSTGIGFLLSKGYENRISHLQDLITLLKVLEADMFYRMDPLPQLLNRIGNSHKELAGAFFVQVCKGLESQNSYDFYGSWTSAVGEVYSTSSLSEKDREILSEIGISLGKTDLSNQRSFFSQVYERLGQQIIEAVEIKKTKGKLYQTVMTALGVLTVIVLL